MRLFRHLRSSHVSLDFEKEIQSITKQLIDEYRPDKIILFGSAARGSVALAFQSSHPLSDKPII